MAIDGHREGAYARFGCGPKLTVTGHLEGALYGRPVEIEATEREITLRIADLRSAWRLRRSASTSMLPVLRLLFAYGVGVRVNIGSRLKFNVLPKPSLPLRILAPALNLWRSGAS